MNEKIMEEAMSIIMSAGDARESCRQAIDCLMADDYQKAEALIKTADNQIAQAHHIQTDCIQAAIGGEEFAYNVLFAHAQDTLMTIYSEIGLVRNMMRLYRRLDEKIRTANF